MNAFDKPDILKPVFTRSEQPIEDNKKKSSQTIIRLRRKQKNRLKQLKN